TQFYRNESCGKCVPCRLGAQKLVEVGTELLRGRGAALADEDAAGPAVPGEFLGDARRHVAELSRVMALTSICGLGQVAASPLATALTFFPNACEVPHG